MPAVIEQITPHHPKAQLLLKAAIQEIAALYPEDADGAPPPKRPETGLMMAAWLKGEAVACGVLRPRPSMVGEIKRLYVMPAHRRSGLARQILKALEDLALKIGLETIHLRTGARQPSAIELYESEGYRQTTCFNAYADDPLCIGFEKHLTTARE